LVQEDIQRNIKDRSSSKTDGEENFALVSKERKGKGRYPITNEILVMEEIRRTCSN